MARGNPNGRAPQTAKRGGSTKAQTNRAGGASVSAPSEDASAVALADPTQETPPQVPQAPVVPPQAGMLVLPLPGDPPLVDAPMITGAVHATVSGPFALNADEHREALEVHGEWEVGVELKVDAAAREEFENLRRVVTAERKPLSFPPQGSRGGGYVGNTARDAADLVRMAELLAAGDSSMSPHARAYLEHAHAHQVAHIARIGEAIASPRKRDSHEVWKAARRQVKSTDPDAQMDLLERAKQGLGEITRMLESFEASKQLMRREFRTNQEIGARSSLADMEFGRLLRAGKLGVAHRFASLLGDEVTNMDVLDRKDIESLMRNAMRISRADLAASPNMPQRPLSDLRAATDKRVEALRAVREPGENDHRGLRGEVPPGVDGPAASAERVLSAARMMGRNPTRYRNGQEADPKGASLRVPATLSALRELREQRGSSPMWDGVAIYEEPASPRGNKRRLFAEARMTVRVGRQDVELVASAELGETLARREDTRAEWLRETAARLGVQDLIGGAPIIHRPAGGYRNHRVAIEPLVRDKKTPPTSGQITDLLGKDRCRHEGATWVAVGGGNEIADTARLECPTCHRTRVAVAPMHRLPKDHPVRVAAFSGAPKAGYYDEPGSPTLSSEQRYLMRERYHAALRDDERPIESVEQLTARDGFVETDPTKYAVGFAADGKPAPTARRVRSIRDAMMRR